MDDAGQFAVHGKTLDVFPAAAPRPCRVEHDGGLVTEIRSYDTDTQRSLASSDALVIDPATEIILAAGSEDRPRPFSGEEHRLARYYDRLVAVTEYLPEAALLLDSDVDERAELFFQQVEESYRVGEGDRSGLYLDRADWTALAAGGDQLCEAWTSSVEDVPAFSSDRHPVQRFSRFLEERRQAGDIILLSGEGLALQRLIRTANKAAGASAQPIGCWSDVAGTTGGEMLSFPAPLAAGFRLPGRKVTVVCAADLLGSRALQALAASPVLPFGDAALQIGDVAVDRDNGLCIFEGLVTVGGAGRDEAEALRLRFADDDILMVPVENVDRIWRYGSEPEAVSLDRLGGSSWTTRRVEVEAAMARTARAMTALAKRRAASKTEPLRPDTSAMERFVADFPFNATPDQAAAIDDVLADLAARTPMDRLVCGDVGYGKTEVALRAIAAAVFSGRQAALVAPTTVLARQHAETLRHRFSRFGIEVGQLSRLTTATEARRVRERLANGTLQIVVGTQALAGKTVTFANLALTVIDEEQRFGAKMKTMLRTLGQSGRRDPQPGHVLTMTATPIPQTLQEAVSGLHAMSLLTTPPSARQPVRTLVRPFDRGIVAEALLRERARGGQSFVVCPRIEDLDPLAAVLAAAAPDLAITIAHGKLKAAEMDDRIVRFAAGDGDVLLATSIIESGLDVPRANTMIVHRADRFGLAELHQLRGRVGRGERRGIVHLTTEPDETLSPVAERRLEAIEKLDRLGAGFAIAGRDLDLRGAGDLVGEEQAGHVQRIGIGLYQHLLQLALASAAGKPAEDWSPELAVGAPGRIPHEFVPDPETRLALYTRLFRARSGDEIEAWLEEVTDRFGPQPVEVSQLARTARLRAACRRIGVTRLVAGPEGIAADLRPGRSAPRRVVWKKPNPGGDGRADLAGRFLKRLANGKSAAEARPGPAGSSAAGARA